MGFVVFPDEFVCPSSKHPFVDIAARMGAHYWAFEYKSERDNPSRAIEQSQSYSEWFDYVVVVSERWLDHRKSSIYWRLKSEGVGVWNYLTSSGRCIVETNPELQEPDKRKRKFVRLSFRALSRRACSIGCDYDNNQAILL